MKKCIWKQANNIKFKAVTFNYWWERREKQILNWLRCSQRYFPMRIEIKVSSHASRNNDCHPSATLKIILTVEVNT